MRGARPVIACLPPALALSGCMRRTSPLGRLRNGFVRDPSVAVEIETCRPFFMLGEVASPGQYPYVPNMTVESAVVIAGGFAPRAQRDRVTDASGTGRLVVPPGTPIGPGDTALTGERWF
jgi:polysaccharide export outer membrane protein